MKRIFIVLLVISLSGLCLLLAVEKFTFNMDFYMKSYEKYRIKELTDKNEKELEAITKDLFTYLKDDAGVEVLQENFNKREILHMEDVQKLFKIAFKLKNIFIFLSGVSIAMLLIGKGNKCIKSIVLGLFINWIFLGMLFLMIYFDFNKYFTLFHHIFFSNDLWLLNPKTDLLIQMLPEEFFMTIARRIIVSFISFVSIIQFIGYITMKKGKDNYEKRKNSQKRSFR